MTDRGAYNVILIEKACLEQREFCSRQCDHCEFGLNRYSKKEKMEGINHVIEILRARCPALYLSTEIEDLKEIIRHGDKG